MADGMKYCRNCGQQINKDAKFCGYCGYQFQIPQEVQQEVQQEERPAANICPNCGNENAPGVKFCRYCGNRMEGNQPAYQQSAYQQPAQPQPAYQQPTQPQPFYQQPGDQFQPAYQEPGFEPQYEGQPYETVPKGRVNGLCTAGFVFSLLGIFLFGIPSVFGLIFSVLGLSSARKKNQRGEKRAVAGIIMSAGMIAAVLLAYLFLRNPLMDKYEELTGRTFPLRKLRVQYEDMIEEAGWVVTEDETCIQLSSKDNTFRNYFTYFESSDMYMTGHYELYSGKKAVKYLAGLSNGAFFEEENDVDDRFDRDDRYIENNLVALTCVYDGVVIDGELQNDFEPVTRYYYGIYSLVVKGEQVFDSMELYDLEEGTSFTLIKADQYIDYMYADGSGSAGPAETDDAG